MHAKDVEEETDVQSPDKGLCLFLLFYACRLGFVSGLPE